MHSTTFFSILIGSLAAVEASTSGLRYPSRRAISCPAGANPKCAPGGNINLSKWKLTLPTGDNGRPSEIDNGLLTGCSGYQNPAFFYTQPNDCSMVMRVGGSSANTGCLTTPNSEHCRTELREADPLNWSPSAPRNRLNATLAVLKADDGTHGTVIGQVHIDSSVSIKPACELYYSQSGDIGMAVRMERDTGQAKYTKLANVPLGTTFSYQIAYENGKLGVSINGGNLQPLDTFDLNSPLSYFKVGNYNQGNVPSEVHFFAISAEH